MKVSDNHLSSQLLFEEESLKIPKLELIGALEIGEIGKSIGILKNLPIAIEVRLGDWTIYHASLPGSTIDNQGWIDRKARTVMLKHH